MTRTDGNGGYTLPIDMFTGSDFDSISNYLSDEEIRKWKDKLEIDDTERLIEFFKGIEIERKSRGEASSYHLQAAITASREAQRLEDEYASYSGEPPTESGANVVIKHRSQVISSIISCTCFLESQINECYDSILIQNQENPSPTSYSLEESSIEEQDIKYITNMNDVIEGKIQRNTPFMKKYQLILSMSNSDTYDSGQNPWQDVNIIRKMRNYFVHYKPEEYSHSLTEEEEITHKIGSAVQGKFEENPLVDDNIPFFPFRALSHDCTKWAITSAIEFSDEFYSRIDMQPRYRKNDAISLDEYMS